jgi:SMC interacting uncharacterized protein involved in chromosome segregation
MSRTTEIFERLANAQKESKKYDTLKEDFESLKNDCAKFFSSINEINNRLSMFHDILQAKAKQEDLQSINLKFHNQIDELKKSLDIDEKIKKSVEELKCRFIDLDDYNKDLKNIGICLENYILNNDSSQKSDDSRIKQLEDKIEQLLINKFYETPREQPKPPLKQSIPINRTAISNNIQSNIRTSKST